MSTARREGATRLVIADDQPIVRAGLRMLLEGEPGFEVVAETADIPSTVSALSSQQVDALVIDTHIPGELGVGAVPELVQASPSTAVVVLTMQDDPAVVREALRAGARAYVLKHSAGIELIDAVRAAVAGDTYLNPILGARMAAHFRTAGLEPESVGLQGYYPPGTPEGPRMGVGIVRTLIPVIERCAVATAAEIQIDTLERRLGEEQVAIDAMFKPPTLVGTWARVA